MEHTFSTESKPGFDAIKKRQQAVWSSGDYGVIGTTLQIVGENLVEACGFLYGDKVLDVAAGNGNATLAAARVGCSVTSTDYVPELLEQGARRAAADRLNVEFLTADVEELPFQDSSFAGVLSTFGVMFAPNHVQSANEMLRVCRSGGRIGLANWTPEGLIGRLFKTLAKYMPPQPGVLPPPRWGVESHLQELFGDSAASILVSKRHYNFRYQSALHFVDTFRKWYGPVQKAFASVEAPHQLESELVALISEANVAGSESLVAPSEYLQVVITKG